MHHPWQIAFMQGGLHHYEWPLRMLLVDGLYCRHDFRLIHVQRSQNHNQQMSLLLAPGHVFSRIIGGFTQSSGIQETDQRMAARRIVVQARLARAGLKTVADDSGSITGECADQ